VCGGALLLETRDRLIYDDDRERFVLERAYEPYEPISGAKNVVGRLRLMRAKKEASPPSEDSGLVGMTGARPRSVVGMPQDGLDLVLPCPG
jgi:hypothetical protein